VVERAGIFDAQRPGHEKPLNTGGSQMSRFKT
jgi:hypothetical protein